MNALGPIFLTLSIFSATLAQAKDVNLGTVHNGKVETKLSIQFNASGGAVVRYAPKRYELKCTRFRPDLCGVEDRVKVIEVELGANDFDFRSSALAVFEFPTFGSHSIVQAILDDGTKIEIRSPSGKLHIFTKTSMDWIGPNKFAPTTKTQISIDLWGHRADGLDPIVSNEEIPSFFRSEESYVEVAESLF